MPAERQIKHISIFSLPRNPCPLSPKKTLRRCSNGSPLKKQIKVDEEGEDELRLPSQVRIPKSSWAGEMSDLTSSESQCSCLCCWRSSLKRGVPRGSGNVYPLRVSVYVLGLWLFMWCLRLNTPEQKNTVEKLAKDRTCTSELLPGALTEILEELSDLWHEGISHDVITQISPRRLKRRSAPIEFSVNPRIGGQVPGAPLTDLLQKSEDLVDRNCPIFVGYNVIQTWLDIRIQVRLECLSQD